MAVSNPGAQVLRHQALQCGPFEAFATIDRPLRPQGAEDSGVEEKKLRMGGRLALGAPAKDKNPEPQEQVFENLHIAGKRDFFSGMLKNDFEIPICASFRILSFH
jgi:hypothetical protein